MRVPSPFLFTIPESYQLDQTHFNKILNEIGEIYQRNKSLEIMNEMLIEQNISLINQNLMMKKLIEEIQNN